MCWGGGLLSHFLLSIPPPQILSAYPTINYLSTHIFLGIVLNALGAPSAKTIDTVLPLLDAIMRTGAICSTVNIVTAHPNPAISSSLFLQLLIGAIASSGGGVAASTLAVWDPQWSLRTPPFLRGGVVDTLDVWSGSVAAAVYGSLLALHPSYEPITRLLSGNGEAYITGTPLMSPLEARSASVLVLTVLYSYRVYATHYSAAKVAPPVKTVSSIKEKDL